VQHNLQAEDFGIRLRPVRLSDAAFIVWLRNLEHVRGRVGDSAATVASQTAWLEKYFERAGDYYFVAESLGGIALGTHGIYDLANGSAEKGRQAVRPEVMAGVATAMLATDLAFGPLGLRELRSNTVSTNTNVISLHRKSGFKQVGVLQNHQIIDGKPIDLLKFLLRPEDWAVARERQVGLARLAGAQIQEWAATQAGKKQPWECNPAG
jgi:RimJ/RimL family protein N-acetyltransferase